MERRKDRLHEKVIIILEFVAITSVQLITGLRLLIKLAAGFVYGNGINQRKMDGKITKKGPAEGKTFRNPSVLCQQGTKFWSNRNLTEEQKRFR